jgi:hypothetical protein
MTLALVFLAAVVVCGAFATLTYHWGYHAGLADAIAEKERAYRRAMGH